MPKVPSQPGWRRRKKSRRRREEEEDEACECLC